MMEITFHPLASIPPSEPAAMLNDPGVRRHMPLSQGVSTESSALDWAKGKDAQWTENGYGPWAIRLDGTFGGWGGFQKEGDEADLGLVLLPGQWGHGAAIFRELLRRGEDLPLPAITIMLPPSRPRLKSLVRLGFVSAGEVEHAGHRFLKFRLVRRG